MAVGKISQEIALKVTGLDDVKSAEKLVDKLDGTKAKIELDADTKEAKKNIDEVIDDLKKLDGDNYTIALALVDAQLQGQLTDILADVTNLDGKSVDITAKMDNADKISGDIAKIEAEIKSVNATPVDINTSGATKGLDDIGKSADSSKSVLANMVGNTTQDLGALGGVAGSAGVAIGQMGEYMADALGSGEKLGSVVASFGKVALPLAAVAVATQIISSHLADVAATKAFNKERVASFVEAMKDGVVVASELQDILSGGTGKTDLLVRVDDQTVNAERSVKSLIGNFDVFAKTVAGGLPAYDAWAAGQIAAGKAAGFSSEKLTYLRKVLDDARDGTVNGATASGAYATGMTNQMLAALALGDSIAKGGTAAKDAAFDAEFYGAALDDAATSTVSVTDARGLDVNAALAQQAAITKVTDAEAASTAAKEAATQAAKDLAKAQEDYNEAINSTDWGATQWEGAQAGMASYSEHLFGLKNIAADAAVATENFTKSIKDNGFTFDLNTEKGRKNQSALEDLSRTLDTKMTAAYLSANGNQEAFIASATTLGDDTLTKLAKSMGLSTTQTDELRTSLGLTQGDYEARFKLSGDEEAKGKIALLQGAIEGLPKDVQAKITQQIIAGDYQGAVTTAQNFLNGHPLTVEVFPHYNFRQFAKGGLVGPEGGIAGEAGPEVARSMTGQMAFLGGPSYVPPGTVVTSASETARMLGLLGGNSPQPSIINQTVIVNVPQGYRERDAVEAAYRSTIRSGKLYANR